ncbi:uncharacterized protein prr14 [Corythoichthys intestinalis]|uniref:uncharacterized protein prr14 n=1 Tax=Corythoichthys intestinalis TaxID=161448 RepID=UPI0025A57395|nr:uncharacterized protein prr14 [Corythoichthys intestinalis]
MLTFPSDSLPHLVFPMDGDAMPPHPFCSAPPHSEPPPPLPSLLPLPSITSRAGDGTSGHRKRGHVQTIKSQVEQKVATLSTNNPSSFRRQSDNMVQVSLAKQPRVECTYENDKHEQDSCDVNPPKEFQNAEKDFAEEQDSRHLKTSELILACEAPSNVVNVSASASNGWLMGPLFQSFKSKMASFTEIVMSPTKLFKDKNLPAPEHEPNETDLFSETEREPQENGKWEENHSLFTQVLQPGSDCYHSHTLQSSLPEEVEVPSSQEVSLLQNPNLKIDNVVVEAEVPTRLTTKPGVENSPALHSCNVQLECFHCISHDASALVPDHVDIASQQTKSGLVRSKVWVERKRLKSDTQSDVVKHRKQKAPSALTDGQDALKPATKCRNVKRDAKSDKQNDIEKKAQKAHAVPAEPVLLVRMANTSTRKRKSLGPTPSAISVYLPVTTLPVAQNDGVPDTGRAGPIKRPKKASQGGIEVHTKKTEAKLAKAQMSTEPLYFEMTRFESNPSECTEPDQNGDVGSNATRLLDGRVHRKQSKKPRSNRAPTHNMKTSAMAEDLPTQTGQGVSAVGLLRSSSCPEIPSLFAPLPRQSPHALVPVQVPGGSHRTRRHTVSGMEVEREIAPLCLRKEVYPSRRSFPCDGQNLLPTLAPASSLSVLVSCFLSSPLAFLSGRDEGSLAAAGSATSSSSPSLVRTESPGGALDACTSTSQLADELDGRTCSEEYYEDTGPSGQEFDEATAALREEKSLSDFELKTSQKHEQGGKVSSIRIRRALPKPQNNLTPMGLPKAVRLKKKQFSLEEIYTNKNFSKPPESRLETILEVPLSRRDGAELFFGQRRIKRSVVFPEMGAARKPKKVAVGGGKVGVVSSRTRRGGFAKGGTTPSLLPPPDADTLLCSKLKQLDLWISSDRADAGC